MLLCVGVVGLTINFEIFIYKLNNMSKEMREQIDKIKKFGEFCNENIKQTPPNEPKKVINHNQLTDLLNTIGYDKTFINYANKHGRKDYICNDFDSDKLIHGFCNPLAYYIKDRYLGISVYKGINDIDGNHLFIKFKDKFYDGKNTNGVNSPVEFDFFTSKEGIEIKLLEK